MRCSGQMDELSKMSNVTRWLSVTDRRHCVTHALKYRASTLLDSKSYTLKDVKKRNNISKLLYKSCRMQQI